MRSRVRPNWRWRPGPPADRDRLTDSLTQFWDAVDRTFALAADGREEAARGAGVAVAAGPTGGAQHRRRAAPHREQRGRGAGGAARPGDLRSGAASGLLVPDGHARRDCGHRSLSDSRQPATLRRARVALRRPARAGAAAHRDPRVDAASPVARAARRGRSDSDRHRIDARAGAEADARRFAAARRPARNRRDGPGHA